jgi:hypothetical protein
MRCPTCGREFRYLFNLAHGTHVEYHCACGRFLQWDQPVRTIALRAFIIGQPQPCEHAELKHPDALFPCGGPAAQGGVEG